MSNQTSDNNKRIAKNTLLLYLRMFLTMTVSLYTSRIILNTLGVEDYGINNVVGGIVTMFTVISGSLSASISRFITFELGKDNIHRLKKVFSTGVNIQIGMSLLIVLLAECVGVWFLNTKMNIPPERLGAANWVFQCSILTFVLNLLSVPYNAAVIAHEKMSAFAYISILEVSLKLIIVYMLIISPFDRLKTYAVLFLCVGAIIRFIYGYYCKRHFEECSYYFVYDKPLLKEMTSFAGWNFFGTSAWMLNTQGLNILINMYFGVAFNAARGVATQVDSALKQFINNFTTAVNPQITKSYAQGDLEYVYTLVCSSAKYSAFLMSFFAIPILIEADTILQLWLKTPPAGTTVFLRWIIVSSFIDTVLANPLFTAMMATGKIKKYQIVVSLVGVLVFPISWLAFYLGYEAQTCYVIYAFIYTILLFVKLTLLQEMIGLSLVRYVKSVLVRVVPIICIACVLSYGLTLLIPMGILRVIVIGIFSTVCIATLIYSLGLSKSERVFVTKKIKNIYNHGYKK